MAEAGSGPQVVELVPAALAGERVDRVVALVTGCSRSEAVALVGGGHVGHAIVQALLPLPFSIHWADSREGVFPALNHERLRMNQFDDITECIDEFPRESLLLITSFTHAEDLEVVRAALARRRSEPQCFPFIGLIGSKTKWARFRHRLNERGFSETELAAVTCPIGIAGIIGKQPAVIAASVAAQLLSRRPI